MLTVGGGTHWEGGGGFWGMFLGYSSYACQSGNRTEVIAHPGSLIFTPSPVQSTRLSLPSPLISARSSPFHLFSLFLSRLLLVTDGVRKTTWKVDGRRRRDIAASHVKCQKTKALKKQTEPHSPVRGRKGGWPKRRDCVIICACVCVCVFV